MKHTSLQAPRIHKTCAFISYSHRDSHEAAQAKHVLESFGLAAFLAHEDLEISDEWQARILDELRRCELFVPLLSAHFVESKWAPQEIGFVVSRTNVVIAPLSLDGTIPFGFISHLQCRRAANGITENVLVEPLARKLPRQIVPTLIYNAAEVEDFDVAEIRMQALAPLFEVLTPREARDLGRACAENEQLCCAPKCRERYIPDFIEAQLSNIDPSAVAAMRYQIASGEKWEPGIVPAHSWHSTSTAKGKVTYEIVRNRRI